MTNHLVHTQGRTFGWFSLGLMLAGLALAPTPARAASMTPASMVLAPARTLTNPDKELEAKERQIDKKNMRLIFDAIMAFKKKNGDFPDFLCDLFPDFLQDTNVLVSPTHVRLGKIPSMSYKDPKYATSYSYYFTPSGVGDTLSERQDLSMKEWRKIQMEEFGEAIPIARMRWVDAELGERSLSITYSGMFLETAKGWETDTNMSALLAMLPPTPGIKDSRKLQLTVQDTAGRPLSDAAVTASRRRAEYGPLPNRKSKTDAAGRCEINLGGQRPRTLSLEVVKEGYTAQIVRYASADEIPGESVIKMAKSVTIGGLVQDDKAKPIAGANVVVYGTVKDAVGQISLAEYETVRTDFAGKWVSKRVPETFDSLSFKVIHDEFMPAEYDQAATGETSGNLLTKESLLAGKAVMSLEPGIVVEGTVSSDAKQPLAGAQISLTWFTGDEDSRRVRSKETRANPDGKFRFVVTEQASGTLAGQAPGFAPKAEKVSIHRDAKPVALQLDKGRTVKGRVQDSQGKPVGGASLRVASWNEVSGLTWHTNSDAKGEFCWALAPNDAFVLSVSRSNYISSLVQCQPGSGDLKVVLEKPFQLSGKVVDADTKQPISRFSIVPGYFYGSEDDYYRWERYNVSQFRNGQYQISNSQRRGQRFRYLCEAEGYIPAVSPTYNDMGSHDFNFELKRGKGPRGVVQLPGGEPVSGAIVLLVDKATTGYMDEPGQFRPMSDGGLRAVADAKGEFELPACLDPDTVFVADEKGFAEVPVETLASTQKIVLQPWGKVSGVLKVGGKVDPSTQVALHNMNYRYAYPRRVYGQAPLSLYLTETPDEQGNFTFEKVPPGERKLFVLYKIHEGAGTMPLSHGQYLNIKPGDDLKVTLGGNGRTVVGKMKLKNGGPDDVDWMRDVHTLASVQEAVPDLGAESPYGKTFNSDDERRKAVAAYQEKLNKFWGSDEGKKRQQAERSYVLLFQPDGSFRIDDVLPGRYNLNISATDPTAERYSYRQVGNLNKLVSVEEAAPGKPSEPVDLGTLEMTVRKTLRVGSEAPPIEAKTLDDKPLKLSDYRGKVVLLTFWQARSAESSNLPMFKSIYDKFGKKERFAMISLSTDPSKKTVQDVVSKENLGWTQGLLGGWNEVTTAYNVQSVPAAFLIDPDGKVVARDLYGASIANAVEKALSEE